MLSQEGEPVLTERDLNILFRILHELEIRGGIVTELDAQTADERYYLG